MQLLPGYCYAITRMFTVVAKMVRKVAWQLIYINWEVLGIVDARVLLCSS